MIGKVSISSCQKKSIGDEGAGGLIITDRSDVFRLVGLALQHMSIANDK